MMIIKQAMTPFEMKTIRTAHSNECQLNLYYFWSPMVMNSICLFEPQYSELIPNLFTQTHCPFTDHQIQEANAQFTLPICN